MARKLLLDSPGHPPDECPLQSRISVQASLLTTSSAPAASVRCHGPSAKTSHAKSTCPGAHPAGYCVSRTCFLGHWACARQFASTSQPTASQAQAMPSADLQLAEGRLGRPQAGALPTVSSYCWAHAAPAGLACKEEVWQVYTDQAEGDHHHNANELAATVTYSPQTLMA